MDCFRWLELEVTKKLLDWVQTENEEGVDRTC